MTKEKFIAKVVNELIQDKFSVIILQDKIKEGCGGWFDHTRRQYLCCMGNDLGFDIFIHEYCHYLQWKTKTKFFKKLCKSVDSFFGWLEDPNISISDEKLDKIVNDCIELEYDCEKMAISLIKKYKLDVNLDVYIRAANAYLMFYHAVKAKRVWTTDQSPYNSKILNLVSNEMKDLKYYQDPANMTETQKKHYFNILDK